MLSSYFGIIIPAILNLIGLCGFNILNGILGGQALASVSNNMSWKCVYDIHRPVIYLTFFHISVGIVIIYIIALLVSLSRDPWTSRLTITVDLLHGLQSSQLVIDALHSNHVSSSSFSGMNASLGSQLSSHSSLHWGSAVKICIMLSQPNLHLLLPFSVLLLLLQGS